MSEQEFIRSRQRRWLDCLSGAMLVTHMPNVRYLTGFTGSSGVLATAKGKLAFFTDGRYTTQARSEVAGARVMVRKKAAMAGALAWLAAHGASRVIVEAEHVTLAQSSQIKKLLKQSQAVLRVHPEAEVVSRLRMIKDGEEIRRIREAVDLASSCFERLLAALSPQATEIEAAAQLEFACRMAGAEGMSFETIVAAGERSALPHGVASSARIPKRGFVVLDYGVILAGYCSDMTRTVFIGRPSAKERSMYEAVLEAHEAAKAAVRPGATAGDVDGAARKVLTRAKLGRYFTHSTGHGVGLEIHEPPRLGKKQTEQLQEGMVITIEPGVYIPHEGGVRIEDMVLVTSGGCETLTPTTKSLLTL
ncbi:MAG: Xaa-Pro peptidase family protein [Acidobacteriaceae bacterium]